MSGFICPFMSKADLLSYCIKDCKFYSEGLNDKCLIKEALEVLFMQHDDLNDIRIELEDIKNKA